MAHSRRDFLQRGSVAAAALSAAALTPAQAFAAKRAYQVLGTEEVGVLEALAETLVPGARTAGVAHLLDSQLSVEPTKAMLMLRYLGVPAEQMLSFYQAGLANAATLARKTFDKPWASLATGDKMTLVGNMFGDTTPDWQGAPASFFAFVIRADACDVVYGTKAGFERIGMPHMAHIDAQSEW